MIRIALVPTLLLSALILLAACDDGGDDSPSAQPSAAGTSGPTFTPSSDIQTAIATLGRTSPRETPVPGAERAPEVAASEDLASRLNQPIEDIVVLSIVAVDWPDACLGAPVEGEVCAQTITPGFEVQLQVGSTTYIYHTNQNGTVARFADVSIEGTGEDGDGG